MKGMSAFDMVREVGDVEFGTGMGLGGELAATGAGAAASFALGHAYHRFGNRWYGRGAPRVVAGVFKIAAVAIHAATGGRMPLATGVIDAVGQAGVNAVAMEYGLRSARKATGRRPVMLAAGAALPPGAEEVTAVGELPAAAPGAGMSWSELAELAKGR